ncbi:cell division control protein 42 homolog isoform X1 [Babylonia areolata]|uniref:cell division control protein 42 homolog isoform X1 n=1 Tax=Babylonia areolata TaxID=304850 RepID=UPI003FD5EC32
MAEKVVKCILVGDRAENRTRSTQVILGQERVTLDLWITCGLDGCERFRQLCYPGADIFMFCFSLVSRQSLSNVSVKWIPEIQRHCPHVPFMIVGTKMDLRTDERKEHQQKPITTDEGERFATTLGAKSYMECSAKSGENLKQTMEQPVRLALTERKPRKNCRLM